MIISIHALRKESDSANPFHPTMFYISIHALRKESDEQETDGCSVYYCISIHALRKESDPTHRNQPNGLDNFNPRSP